MRKKLFILILSLFFVLPCAIFLSGCEEEDLIGISAQESRKQIDYGQVFDPVESFKVRSHYYSGNAEYLTESDLSYTITKNDEIYEYDTLIEGGEYVFEFSYKQTTCKAYLTVNKIDYPEKEQLSINDFGFNEEVSYPTFETLSDGEVNFYYRYQGTSKNTETLWLYEEGDTNTTIVPGDYVIYAKVEEGTNYKSYETSEASFHVYPERLDESFSLSADTISATYIPFGTLTDYETILNENVKLNHLNSETGETEEISGDFRFVNTSKVSFGDSGKLFYISFNSDNHDLNGKEFQITLNLSKYIVTKPILTLDETPISEDFHAVDYDEAPHSIYFVDDTNILFEDDLYYIVDNRNTKIAEVNGDIIATLPGLYETHVSIIVTDGGVCWDDETTETLDFFWDVKKIDVPAAQFEPYLKLLINTNKIISDTEISPDCTEEDFIYVKKNDIIPLLSKTYIIPYENDSGHYSTETLHHYMFFGVFEKNENGEYVPFENYTGEITVLSQGSEDVSQDNNAQSVSTSEVVVSGSDEVVGVCFTLRDLTLPHKITFIANLIGNEIYRDVLVPVNITIGQ